MTTSHLSIRDLPSPNQDDRPDGMPVDMLILHYTDMESGAAAIARLRGKLKYRPVVFELMAPAFTLLELQRAVEALAGLRLHKQNFRRLVADFYAGVAEDPVLRPLYPDELGPAEDRLRMFLVQYWGGPSTYSEQRGHLFGDDLPDDVGEVEVVLRTRLDRSPVDDDPVGPRRRRPQQPPERSDLLLPRRRVLRRHLLDGELGCGITRPEVRPEPVRCLEHQHVEALPARLHRRHGGPRHRPPDAAPVALPTSPSSHDGHATACLHPGVGGAT